MNAECCGNRLTRHASLASARVGWRNKGLWVEIARLMLPLALLFALALTWKLLDSSWVERITRHAREIPDAPWAVFFVILTYALLSLCVFPISVLLYGTILTFGFSFGVLYALAGAMVAAMLNYYLGVWFSGRSTTNFFESRKLDDLKEALQRPSLSTIIVIRLTPLAPFTIENYLAGALRVDVRLYALGTFFGLLPGIVSIALVTTALKGYVENPVYFVPIYGLVSAALLLLVAVGSRVTRACARFCMQKRFDSTLHTTLETVSGADIHFRGRLWLRDYLHALEGLNESQNYFVEVASTGAAKALLLFQVITVTPIEFLNYVREAGSLGKTYVRRWIGYCIKNRRIRILVHGLPNLTGDFRAATPQPPAVALDAFLAAYKLLKDKLDFDAVIIKDMPASDRAKPAEFRRFQVDPNMVVRIEWSSMAEYVAMLRTKYRQRYTSTLRKSADIQVRHLDKNEIEYWSEQLQRLFASVVKPDKFNLEQVPVGYFLRLAQLDAFSLYGYFLGDQLVGFRSSLDAGPNLLAHFVGFDDAVNEERKIYLRMLYDYIAEGIEHKKSAVHLGRTALEIKSSVGAMREDLNLLFYADRWFYRTAGNYYVSRLKPTRFEARSPFRDE